MSLVDATKSEIVFGDLEEYGAFLELYVQGDTFNSLDFSVVNKVKRFIRLVDDERVFATKYECEPEVTDKCVELLALLMPLISPIESTGVFAGLVDQTRRTRTRRGFKGRGLSVSKTLDRKGGEYGRPNWSEMPAERSLSLQNTLAIRNSTGEG